MLTVRSRRWLSSFLAPAPRPARAFRPRGFRPGLETLEDRLAPAALNAGDLAVTGWDALTNKVAFVTLVDIPAGTALVITDRGWSPSNAFTSGGTGDTQVTWTPSAAVSAGSVFSLFFGSTPATTTLTDVTTGADLSGDIAVSPFTVDPLPTAGDGIFIYQGTAANPFFITGFNNSGAAGGWSTSIFQTTSPGAVAVGAATVTPAVMPSGLAVGTELQIDDGTASVEAVRVTAVTATSFTATFTKAHAAGFTISLSLRDSLLPDGTGSQNALVNGTDALGLSAPEHANYQYTGPTSLSDRNGWLARLVNANNWAGDNTGTTTSTIGTTTGSSLVIVSTPAPNAAFVVDNPVDEEDGDTSPGHLSLREAVDLANILPDANTITFAPALTAGGPAVLNLSLVGDTTAGDSAFRISTPMTIQGPGAASLTLAGPGNVGTTMRLFLVSAAGDLTLTGLTLTGGVADGSAPGGGAVENLGKLTLNSAVLSGNLATSSTTFAYGGAVYNRGTATVNQSSFTGNSAVSTAAGSYGYGGAIFNYDPAQASTVTITDSTFSNNSAFVGGAIDSFSVVTVQGSTFAGNHAAGNGGALENRVGAKMSLTNSTLNQNTSAASGGSIRNLGTLSLVNSTLAGNTATNSGGGLSQSPTYGTSTVANTILAGNSAAAAPDMDGAVAATKSLFGNTGGATVTGSGNLLNVNPQLGALADNGGPTQTMALAPTSPAVNAGDNASAAGLTTDQRGAGFDRVVFGTVDIGAFEIQAPTTVYVDDSWAGTPIGTDPASDPIGSLIFGYNAFADVQSGLNAVAAGGTLVIFGGTYAGAVDFNKALAAVQLNTNSTTPAQTLVAINGTTTVSAADPFVLTAFLPGGGPSQSAADLTFGSSVTLAADTTLTSGDGRNITFGGTVQSPGTAHALTVNTAGATVFNGAVGGGGNTLGALTTDAGGTTQINGGSVDTSGFAQTYNDDVTLGSAFTLLAGIVNFDAGLTLGATAATATSTLQIAGTLNFTNTTTLTTTFAGTAPSQVGHILAGGGNTTYGGATLALNYSAFTPAGGDSFDVVSNGGFGIGQFTNAPAPGPVTLNGTPYLVTYSGSAGGGDFILTAAQAPAITSGNATTFTVGSAGTFTVTATGTPAPTFSLTGAPAWLSINSSTGVINGTPPNLGAGPYSFTFTVTASNGIAPDATQSFTLTVNQPPAITSGGSTTFTVGAFGSFTVATTGFPAPSLSESGALPGGVQFVDNGDGTATLSGTPAAGSVADYPITITAHNGVGSDATQPFTLTVAKAASSTALSTDHPGGSVYGEPVTFTATVTAPIPVTGSVAFFDGTTQIGSGSLNGSGQATFTTNTLDLANTPHSITATFAGDANTDGSGSTAVSAAVSQGTTSTAVGTSQSPATFGTAVTFTATVTANAPSTLAPVGVVDFFDGATDLSGPVAVTAAGAGQATASFTISSLGVAGSPHTIRAVYADPAGNYAGSSGTVQQAVTAASTTTAAANQSATFGAADQNVTLSATVTSPAGAVNEGTVTFAVLQGSTQVGSSVTSGTVSGGSASATYVLPGGTAAATYTVVATYNTGPDFLTSSDNTHSLTVNGVPPTITSANATTFTSGQPGTFTVTTAGSPAPTFSLTGAPSWLSISPSSGVMLGTPPNLGAGPYVFHFTVTAGNGVTPDATQNFTLTVNQAPAFTSANHATFTQGSAGSFTVTASGNPAPTLSLTGTLPAGVTFNAATGVLSGTPTTSTGSPFSVTFTAHNGVGSDATQPFTLTVNPAITLGPTSLPVATVANAYSQQLTGGGGSGTGFTFVVASGSSLPAGLTLSSGGLLSGTPTAAGTFTFTVTATDSNGATGNKDFTLTVNPAITLSPTTLPPTSQGATYRQPLTAAGGSGAGFTFKLADGSSLPPGLRLLNTGTILGSPSTPAGSPFTFSVTATDSNGATGTQAYTLTVAPGIGRVIGATAGQPPVVQVLNVDGSERFRVTAFDPNFTGGVTTALGDVTGDGVPDLLVGAGPGGGPSVAVYDGQAGGYLGTFFAFDPNFTGGVTVAAGDVNNDGFADLVIGAGPGGGPNVIVLSGTDRRTVLDNFMAFDPRFTGGVSVGAGDVNGDGFADVAVGAGPGGGPSVAVFDGRSGALLANYFAYDRLFTGGVEVALGDVRHVGVDQVLTGPGANGGPTVQIIEALSGAKLASFAAYPSTQLAGVRVGVGRASSDNRLVLLTGPAADAATFDAGFDGLTQDRIDQFFLATNT